MSSVSFVLHGCEINKHITSACAYIKSIIQTWQTRILCKHHENLEEIIASIIFIYRDEWVNK